MLLCISLVVFNNKGDEHDIMEASRGSLRHPPFFYTVTKVIKTEET